jgi:hypothetical protein
MAITDTLRKNFNNGHFDGKMEVHFEPKMENIFGPQTPFVGGVTNKIRPRGSDKGEK